MPLEELKIIAKLYLNEKLEKEYKLKVNKLVAEQDANDFKLTLYKTLTMRTVQPR